MAPTTTAARKRKTTEEMEVSPPKRQTRARAAKVNEEASGPKPTRITTASARIAAEARAAAAKTAPKPIKKKTRSTDKDEKDSKAESKTRTTTRKPIEVKSDVKPRARVVKAAEKPVLEKTTTRTRKNATMAKPEVPAPVVTRSTRTRSATLESQAPVEAAPVIKKVVKRVTFQEDLIQDKENKPVASTSKREPVKSTGIKAKPVRKPTVTRTTVRDKKAMGKIEEKPTPLSPKKVSQVAKTGSSSEDELAKTPLRKIWKTRAKPEVDQSSTPEKTIAKSPIRNAPVENEMATLLASPAKRVPPSPFKDALRQSPKRIPLGVMPDFSGKDDHDAIKEPLKQSPIKFDFTPLKASGTAGQASNTAATSARAALLGSPARRPASPLKLGSVRMPEKVAHPQPLTHTTSILRHVKDNSLFAATPRKLFASPEKTSKKIAATVKEPEIVPDEAMDVAFAVEDPTITEAHVQTPYGFKKYSQPACFGKPEETFERDMFEESGQYRSLDDGSEDELTTGPLTLSPRKNAYLIRRLASSPSAESPKSTMKAAATPRTRVKDHFMTPLATQLSGWLAASPTKSEEERDEDSTVYTPMGVVRRQKESRRATMTPAKPSYFEEQLPETNVLATPEELMQNQDLHTNADDDEMVDDIPESSVEIVLATPEGSIGQSIDVTLKNTEIPFEEFVDVVAESFDNSLNESNEPIVAQAKEETNEVEASGTPTPEEIDASVLEDVTNFVSASEQDPTVIITHPEEVYTTDELDNLLDTPTELESTADANVDMAGDEPVLTEEHPPIDTEVYGDENSAPAVEEPMVVIMSPDVTHAMSLETPAKAIRTRSKEVCTVSKIPLKSEYYETPAQFKMRKARSKSLSAPLAELSVGEELMPVKNEDGAADKQPAAHTPVRTPRTVSQPLAAPATPGDELISMANSPFKSVRKGLDAQILNGAIVHVDVHTSEGADASGIFIELLTQMGARCIKQWNWNSRSTLGGGEDPAVNTKIGITHVVFKDGSKRTLQKVREAKGLVLCVGVGWVLDCERANRWLDEAPFAVDTSTIPRGGHNRRKSMEPKMLANLEGNLVAARTPAKSSRKSVRLSKTRDSVVPPVVEVDADETILMPFTPGQDLNGATPKASLVSNENDKLLQQTCPPKQARQLFPLSGNIDDQPDEAVRQRLAKARRQTMAFAPKIGSPLGRDFPGKD